MAHDPKQPAVIVIGNFDGVHRGHRAVVGQARALADDRAVRCRVLTFDPHPSEVLGRGRPPRLASHAQKVELLTRAGAHDVIALPFTTELASWSPERFAQDLLVTELAARAVVVGDNFRFGKGRAGDFATLRALGDTLGFEAVAAQIAGDERGPFSSTRVRDAIGAGDVTTAAHVLGRWHAITGTVTPGDRLGRTLGFPTANLDAIPQMVPANGVYAIRVDLGGATANGVMNVGMRPTVGGLSRRVEAHLFDVDADLYGRTLEVQFVERLRGEQKFADLDALKRQIAEDCLGARRVFERVLPKVDGSG